MEDSYASGSQSGSALDLVLANGENTERGSRDHLRRNDSFEPEISRSTQKSPAQSWHMDTEKPHQTSYDHELTLESFSREVDPAWSIPMTRQDRHQELSLGHHAKAMAENNSHDTASARRKEKALSRLHLIFSQMPAATRSSDAAALRQTDSLESAYNQICGGEDAQEWAEFEASLFRTYNGQSQAIGQDLKQTQQHEQNTTIVSGRQAPMGVNLQETHMLQNLKPSREIATQQDQPQKKDDERSKSKEPMIEFHCPWIDCHSVRMFPLEAVRDCSLMRCKEIPGM